MWNGSVGKYRRDASQTDAHERSSYPRRCLLALFLVRLLSLHPPSIPPHPSRGTVHAPHNDVKLLTHLEALLSDFAAV